MENEEFMKAITEDIEMQEQLAAEQEELERIERGEVFTEDEDGA